ncbi:MAG: hypothetical protein ACEPOW_08355 [Bacteroidales bacterium]
MCIGLFTLFGTCEKENHVKTDVKPVNERNMTFGSYGEMHNEVLKFFYEEANGEEIVRNNLTPEVGVEMINAVTPFLLKKNISQEEIDYLKEIAPEYLSPVTDLISNIDSLSLTPDYIFTAESLDKIMGKETFDYYYTDMLVSANASIEFINAVKEVFAFIRENSCDMEACVNFVVNDFGSTSFNNSHDEKMKHTFIDIFTHSASFWENFLSEKNAMINVNSTSNSRECIHLGTYKQGTVCIVIDTLVGLITVETGAGSIIIGGGASAVAYELLDAERYDAWLIGGSIIITPHPPRT